MTRKQRPAALLTICLCLLISPREAEAAELKTYCGFDEHVHTRENGCYTDYILSDCGSAEHIHAETCFPEESGELCCALPEHTHSPECNVRTEVFLACTRPVHEHTDMCFSNPDSRESPAEWEASLAGVKLTKEWDKDLVSTAESQLGYSGRADNFILDAKGNRKLYTRYGAWYHNPYGDWCAMFVSFCLHYAGIPEESFPRNASCGLWQTELKELGMYREAVCGDNLFIPEPGDIIFFGSKQTGSASHVGIVSALLYEDEDAPAAVTGVETIEGNHGYRVDRFRYPLKDKRIVGYGVLPGNPGPDYYIREDGYVSYFTTTASGVKIILTSARSAFPYPLEELRLEAGELGITSEDGTLTPFEPRRFEIWLSRDGEIVPLLDDAEISAEESGERIKIKEASGSGAELEARVSLGQ